MLITITRTGGFTGIPIKKTIDTTTLPPKVKRDVRLMIQDLRKGQENLSLDQKKSNPDGFTYAISIQDSTISQTITVNEKSLNSTAQKLIDYINSL